jgi:uncharacterized metal-binding protein
MLAREGFGKMYRLAGVGGRVPGMMSNLHSASRILVIDGCDKKCALATMAMTRLPVQEHLNLAEIGMEKGKTPANADNIQKIGEEGKKLLKRSKAARS